MLLYLNVQIALDCKIYLAKRILSSHCFLNEISYKKFCARRAKYTLNDELLNKC